MLCLVGSMAGRLRGFSEIGRACSVVSQECGDRQEVWTCDVSACYRWRGYLMSQSK